MVDRSEFNAEDFLVDSTFQQYCAGTDELCIEYWEKYIKAHPEQLQVITEAKNLYSILSGNRRKLTEQVENLGKKLFPQGKIETRSSFLWLKIAATIVVIIAATLAYLSYNRFKAQEQTEEVFTWATQSGERKKIRLSDGTVVMLNAKSALSIVKGFGKERREVNLTGEAFFDVVHCKDVPFQVHTSEFNINVLGTAFNVKAYPDETTSEATLIRGLITMEAVNGSGIITLKPSQKVTVYKNALQPQKRAKLVKPSLSRPEITINHYTLIKDSTIVETAWTKNRIEIYDQDFDEIKGALEKWYNVKIKFTNAEVEKYRFTATFSNETIEQALSALQKVENFKYEIKGDLVIISK
ncbi:FecR family protein [Pedobacter endophyticus]|uniref:FecR family protein n=1 Tax=Pedobacter endophyticus TaxID=2789740 RepID=A0A7S9L2Z3_9SPHI|nr:FecR family protein [Pedobacter endophyticus]QPH41534.1 FecR family protein [Pedobacter endophyticus]